MDIFKLALIVPITSNKKPFPFHIMLDDRTETQGAILCEYIRTIDLEARNYKIIEKIPNELLKDVLNNIKLIF